MAQTALSPTLVPSIGSYTPLVVGVAGGSSTTTVVTVKDFHSVIAVVVGGATSATAPYCDTISGNTFTVTHANNDLFSYVAYGKAKV
jgi:hypothetical protein